MAATTRGLAQPPRPRQQRQWRQPPFLPVGREQRREHNNGGHGGHSSGSWDDNDPDCPIDTYPSPIQYECQKNYYIIVTDGIAHRRDDQSGRRHRDALLHGRSVEHGRRQAIRQGVHDRLRHRGGRDPAPDDGRKRRRAVLRRDRRRVAREQPGGRTLGDRRGQLHVRGAAHPVHERQRRERGVHRLVLCPVPPRFGKAT